MCVIIDANVAHKVICNPPDPAGAELRTRIEDRKVRVVCGGKNAEELYGSKLRRWLIEQVRNGSARVMAKGPIKEREAVVQVLCRSDDPHILALAQLAKARLLFSEDTELCDDFKDKRILSRPRGKIYNRSSFKRKNFLERAGRCAWCRGMMARP